jgi:hypothetical protein
MDQARELKRRQLSAESIIGYCRRSSGVNVQIHFCEFLNYINDFFESAAEYSSAAVAATQLSNRMQTGTAVLPSSYFSYFVPPQSDFGRFGPLARLPTIVSDPFPKSRVVARRAASTNHVNFSLD